MDNHQFDSVTAGVLPLFHRFYPFQPPLPLRICNIVSSFPVLAGVGLFCSFRTSHSTSTALHTVHLFLPASPEMRSCVGAMLLLAVLSWPAVCLAGQHNEVRCMEYQQQLTYV